MKNIEILHLLHDLRSQSQDCRLDSGQSLIYRFENRELAEKQLKDANIEYERVSQNELWVDLFKVKFALFFDKKHFLQHCEANSFQRDVGIIFYEGNRFLFRDHAQNTLHDNTGIVLDDYFIENTICYLKLLDAFNASEIVSYHSTASREFVLISPDKGKFLLGYPAITCSMPSQVPVKEKYDSYEQRNPSKDFQMFFKEQIIEALSSKEKDNRFPELLLNMESILESSERNYEIYLNKFSFEELKKNFKKERDEYFSSIREIVNRLLTKIVSLPISISASAFAIYKLKDEHSYAGIVIIAFIVYSLFTSYLIRLLKLDTFEIKNDLDRDIKTIKESASLPEQIIDDESSKVYKKINRLNTTIDILQFVLILLSMLILIISFQVINLPYKWYVISMITVFIAHVITSTFRA